MFKIKLPGKGLSGSYEWIIRLPNHLQAKNSNLDQLHSSAFVLSY